MKKVPSKAPKVSKALKTGKTLKTSRAPKKIKPTPPQPSLRPLYWVLALLFVVAILAAILIGFIRLNQKPLAAFLPQEGIVALLEWEKDQFPAETQGESTTIVPALEQLTGLPLAQLPKEWWSHPFGLLLMDQGEEEDAWVLFAQGVSRQALKENLNQIEAFSFQKPLSTFAQGLQFNFGLSSPYIFLSSSSQAIEALKQVASQKTAVLENEPAFKKAQAHVADQAWLRAYVQLDKVNLPPFPTLHYTLSALSVVAPQAAFSLEEKNQGLLLSSWLPFASSAPEPRSEEKTRILKQMAKGIPAQSAALFTAGPNLTQQWQATLTDLSRMNPAYGVILESLVRSQVEALFGGNVNLRNDLYPLLEGRYAAVLDQAEAGYALGMVVEHEDQRFVEVKLDKLLNGFYALIGRLNPRIKEVSLPDGTQSRELVAHPQQAEKTQEIYKNWTLTCLSAEGEGSSTLKAELLRGLCYTVTVDRFYLATNQSLLERMLQATEGKIPSLAEAPAFRQSLNQLQGRGEERSYVDLEKLTPLLAKSSALKKLSWLPFLSHLKQITWVKDVSSQGVRVEGLIRVK